MSAPLAPVGESTLRQRAIILALLAGLVAGLLGMGGALELLEEPARDMRFRLRQQAGWGPRIPAEIALVLVDDKALADIEIPFSLWTPIWAEVIDRLLAAGAKVVVPDQLWELDPQTIKERNPEYEQVTSGLFQAERRYGMAVLEQPIVVGALLENGVLRRPRPMLFAAAGDRVSLLNLQEDSDGVVRRHHLGAQVAEADQWFPTLAFRAAALFSGWEYETKAEQIPTEDDLMWINYRGPAGSFPATSMGEILQFETTDSRFRDKVVFIGLSANRLGDKHRSPFSRDGERDMPGVEVHANALATMLAKDHLGSAPAIVDLAISLLAALITGLLCWRLRPLLWVSAVGLLLVTIGLACLLAFSFMGLWLQATAPCLAVLLSAIGVTVFRSVTIERARAEALARFGEMVSPRVMKTVLEDPYSLTSGYEGDITVLFADINDFTPICERHTPNQVIDMLGDYFSLMVEVVTSHDGYVKQFVGDEIMVIFGAPESDSDHAAKAVRAGVEMLEKLEQAMGSGRPGFYDVKIGINSGRVVLGKVGAKKRWEYAAVGDEVNLGARIMGTTKKLDCKMLVSDATRKLAETQLEELCWIERGEHNFKGKKQSCLLFEVERKEPLEPADNDNK